MVPRPEYPRPSFARREWLCLNGEWQFEIDAGDSGLHRGLRDKRKLASKIIVPFCPESKLSGVEHMDFLNAVWYRREIDVPNTAGWTGKQVLLHFGACDYDATVWAAESGQPLVEVARHRGGFTPFFADLGEAAGKKITVAVRARDRHNIPQPRGKQSDRFGPYDCYYTRTTGIWQTVWLEPVGKIAMKRPRVTPDLANSRIEVVVPVTAHGPGANVDGLVLRCKLTDSKGMVAEATSRGDLDFSPRVTLEIPVDRRRVWSPEDPHLYGLELELLINGKIIDSATSYAGLRSVSLSGPAFKLNGKVLFQRTVLDQGYYTESIMTAPNDEALIKDIQLSMQAGFNGARLHQKVFEERFLYHADRLGYLVWGEFADWGCRGYGSSTDHQKADATYVAQWLEALERDYSHPCIVGWCPLNETFQQNSDEIRQLDDVTRGMWLAAKLADPTRPVLDTSGYAHRVRESDIYDSHDYEQDPQKFALKMGGLAQGKPFINRGWDGKRTNIPWNGQPYFCSEFGGIWWSSSEDKATWGYGERVRSLEEFHARFEGLCNALLDDPLMFGFCYTQLTDIFPEFNGLFTADRKIKFDLEKIRKVVGKKAAIEIAAEKAAARM